MAASYNTLANPPNLMGLYLQLQQRQSAEDQINRGFALIAANHSSPEMARNIMQSVSGGSGDAGGMMNNLMSLYNAQQGMAGQQALLGQSAAIAAKTGLPEAEVRAQILSGHGDELVRSQLPTDTMRNYQSALGMLTAQGMPKDQAEVMLQPMLLGGASNPMMADYIRQVAEAQKDGTFASKPELASFTSFSANAQAQATGAREAETNKQEAIKNFSLLDGNLSKYVDNLGEIATDPNLGSYVGHPYLDLSKLTEEGRGINQKITGAQTLAKSLATKGGALTSAAMASIGSDAEGLANHGLSADQYQDLVITPQIKQALTAQANNYIASGKTSQMPGYLRPYADPTATLQPRVGVTPNTKLKQMSAEDIADAQSIVEMHGPKAALKFFDDKGYDTSPLR
jgi:hypothetical protein